MVRNGEIKKLTYKQQANNETNFKKLRKMIVMSLQLRFFRRPKTYISTGFQQIHVNDDGNE